jgi:hypothetical protein
MRLLWEPSQPTYLRDFLVCGPFVELMPPSAPPGSQPATAPAKSDSLAATVPPLDEDRGDVDAPCVRK